VYEAAIKGVEATDKGIGIIYEACKEMNYTLFVTADHGNAERMIAQDGTPYTAHTCNKGNFIYIYSSSSFCHDFYYQDIY
jgi:2,3-bisphosphoglycerate-independent phosphoglycerate mutase